MIIHPIPPLYSSDSKTLILGSFPSVKSRELEFFYAHPQNRFWRVMSRICDAPLPTTDEEKAKLILDNNFALWDVIHSCDLTGSADSTIKNVVPNDINFIIESSCVDRIFVNGKKAESLYIKYIERKTSIKAGYLPSTSPANASWSEDKLTEFWKEKLIIS